MLLHIRKPFGMTQFFQSPNLYYFPCWTLFSLNIYISCMQAALTILLTEIVRSEMAPNPRVTKAFRAMREIGINEEKTKRILKKLLKLYEKNWELIEEENYRALADAIFDDEEKDVQQDKCKNSNNGQMEEDNQASDEPERPLKRLRLRGQEGQAISTSSGSGHNVTNGSALKIPKLEENLLPDTSVIKQPQPNESKTPETDSCSLRRVDKGKRPLLPQANPQVTISASDRTSHALRFKEPMIEPGVARLPKKRVSDDHALIKPKDEPFTDDLFAVDTFHIDQPLAVIHPDFSRKGSYSSGNISKKKNDGQDALKSNFVDGDNRCDSAAATSEKEINYELSTGLEGPPPNLEIASSQLGEVKISLSCDLAIGRQDFRMPSRDAVIKYLEEKCLRSYKIIDPSFSVMKILSNMCECFLELGTDSPDESQEGSKNNMPPVECAKKSIVGEACSVSPDKEILNTPSLVNEPFMLPFKAGDHAPKVSKVLASSNEVDGDIVDPTVNFRTKMLSENELYVSEISKVSISSDGVDEHIIDPRENINTNIYSENDGIYASEISKASTSSNGADEHIADPSKNISTVIHSNCDGKNKLDSQRMVVSSSCRLKPDDFRVATTDDITKGEERVKISWVNEVNDKNLPPFQYIPSSLIFRNAYANVSLSQIENDKCCETCFGDCVMSSTPCACAQKTGGDYAYTSEGLVNGDFLEKSMSLSLDPLQIFYCIECPIERSKNDASDRPCKGHFRTKLIKECWRKCGCHRQCGNRVVQRGITYSLQVFLTPNEKGWGLRTLEDIPKGAFVCEYVGEILTCQELTRRLSQSTTSGKHTSLLLLDSFWDAKVDLKDEKALCIDATYYGNVGRFINHRCSDANLVNIAVEIENPDSHYYHLAFFTTRKVDAMEELTWDYGIDFEDSDHVIKSFQCQCGSKFCRSRKS